MKIKTLLLPLALLTGALAALPPGNPASALKKCPLHGRTVLPTIETKISPSGQRFRRYECTLSLDGDHDVWLPED